MLKFAHQNFNVADIDKSIAFYQEALGLKKVRQIDAEDGSFVIVFLTDEYDQFRLELTCLKAHPQKYDLGECEFHLAFVTDEFETLKKKHDEMGIICFDNPAMGIYFILDPDGYWIEIVPEGN